MVAWWNAPALRVARDKSGRVAAGTIGWWQLGRWRRYFASGDVQLTPPQGLAVSAGAVHDASVLAGGAEVHLERAYGAKP